MNKIIIPFLTAAAGEGDIDTGNKISIGFKRVVNPEPAADLTEVKDKDDNCANLEEKTCNGGGDDYECIFIKNSESAISKFFPSELNEKCLNVPIFEGCTCDKNHPDHTSHVYGCWVKKDTADRASKPYKILREHILDQVRKDHPNVELQLTKKKGEVEYVWELLPCLNHWKEETSKREKREAPTTTEAPTTEAPKTESEGWIRKPGVCSLRKHSIKDLSTKKGLTTDECLEKCKKEGQGRPACQYYGFDTYNLCNAGYLKYEAIETKLGKTPGLKNAECSKDPDAKITGCSDDSHCEGFNKCEGGKCVPRKGQCSEHKDCEEDEYCGRLVTEEEQVGSFWTRFGAYKKTNVTNLSKEKACYRRGVEGSYCAADFDHDVYDGDKVADDDKCLNDLKCSKDDNEEGAYKCSK